VNRAAEDDYRRRLGHLGDIGVAILCLQGSRDRQRDSRTRKDEQGEYRRGQQSQSQRRFFPANDGTHGKQQSPVEWIEEQGEEFTGIVEHGGPVGNHNPRRRSCATLSICRPVGIGGREADPR
jgi:hypothetical protein